jgi:hypothetical protein
MPHTVILMVGRDRVLVETRSQVLRTAGYIVVPAYTPRQAIDEFVARGFQPRPSLPFDARGCQRTVGERYPRAHIAYSDCLRRVF